LSTAHADDPPTPVVAICVRVPVQAVAGQELEYRICLENRSPAAAHHVIVRNPVPANARFVRASPEPSARDPELQWRLGTLEGGAKREIVLVLSPTVGDDIKNCARVQFEHGECVTTKVARPALKLQKEGPTRALLYDALHYKITLTNTGTAEVANVQLADVLPAGLEHESHKDRLSWIVGKLAPGESQRVEYQVIAKKTGRLCNTAIATAAGGLRESLESCVTVTEAKIGLSMAGPKRRYVAMPAAYQITINNLGTAALQNVVLRNPLPEKMTFISAGESGQFAGNEAQWTLGTLEPGAQRTVDVVLQAETPGRLCNRATVTAERGLTMQAEACTDFAGMPALALEVQDSEDPIQVGSTTAYSITVRNQGTSPATSVRVQATVPGQMEIVEVTGAASHRQVGAKISFDPLPLPAGEDARYRVEVKALRPGDVRFKVELTADQLTAGPVQQEESTTIYATLPSSRKKLAKTFGPKWR
jgi:uncharacterized repeat protein (TIGR01451 family)